MKELTIKTNLPKEIIDLTSRLNSFIKDENIQNGVCNVFVLHTTCSVMVAELDPGTDRDYLKAIEKMFPEGKYIHPHDPSHVGDHVMSSMIGNSTSVPIMDGNLLLGTWQSVVMVELSGPRERKLVVHLS